MPVQLKQVRGRWRTVLQGTSTLARNQATLTPVDGGGWTTREKAKGLRQVGYINEAIKETK